MTARRIVRTAVGLGLLLAFLVAEPAARALSTLPPVLHTPARWSTLGGPGLLALVPEGGRPDGPLDLVVVGRPCAPMRPVWARRALPGIDPLEVARVAVCDDLVAVTSAGRLLAFAASTGAALDVTVPVTPTVLVPGPGGSGVLGVAGPRAHAQGAELVTLDGQGRVTASFPLDEPPPVERRTMALVGARGGRGVALVAATPRGLERIEVEGERRLIVAPTAPVVDLAADPAGRWVGCVDTRGRVVVAAADSGRRAVDERFRHRGEAAQQLALAPDLAYLVLRTQAGLAVVASVPRLDVSVLLVPGPGMGDGEVACDAGGCHVALGGSVFAPTWLRRTLAQRLAPVLWALTPGPGEGTGE